MASQRYFSQYVTMRDGVKLAADIWLPAGRIVPRPTILRQTSYFRSLGLRWPWRLATRGRPIDHSGIYSRGRQLFLSAGYAWVDLDVRGSGASFGHRVGPWSQPEVADAREVVDWIVSQPWCDGNLGSLGVSYDGTAAEMLLIHEHPAVKAVAPSFSCYDAYADVGYPGGIPNIGFTQIWSKLNRALEQNRLQDIAGAWIQLLSGGVTPVTSDPRGRQRAAAIADHQRNYDVLQNMNELIFADDEPALVDAPLTAAFDEKGTELHGLQLVSPYSYARQIRSGSAAIFSISGWWDGAYARAAALRFLATPNPGSRLLLGPWNHGGRSRLERADRPERDHFDLDQKILEFFDLHLRGLSSPICDEPPVRYFTMIESAWRFADSWPPPGPSRASFYLGTNGRLEDAPPVTRSWVKYSRRLIGTGKQGRWRTQAQLNVSVRYSDRRALGDQMLCFKTAALPNAMEVTGHVTVDLYIASDSDDPTLLVYLEDVYPNGDVIVVSEGGLRARHRRLISNDLTLYSAAHAAVGISRHSFLRRDDWRLVPVSDDSLIEDRHIARLQFDILPISYLYRRGHRLQISISMADIDNFVPSACHSIWILNGGACASRIELPVCKLV